MAELTGECDCSASSYGLSREECATHLHRLGQKRETTVYCYYTRDTVESRILASNVRGGTSIYLKPDDVDKDAAEEALGNVAAGASKGGDQGGDEAGEDAELLALIL